eukprot:gene23277-biopygen54352
MDFGPVSEERRRSGDRRPRVVRPLHRVEPPQHPGAARGAQVGVEQYRAGCAVTAPRGPPAQRTRAHALRGYRRGGPHLVPGKAKCSKVLDDSSSPTRVLPTMGLGKVKTAHGTRGGAVT